MIAEYSVVVRRKAGRLSSDEEIDKVLNRLDELEPDSSLEAVATRLREGLGDLAADVEIEVLA